MAFADELVKNEINIVLNKRNLFLGEKITYFIERGIKTCDFIILICSEEYTRKANERIEGVGLEAVAGSSAYFYTKDKRKFIPVVRDNNLPPKDKISTCLGSALYIDIEGNDWGDHLESSYTPFIKLLMRRSRLIMTYR